MELCVLLVGCNILHNYPKLFWNCAGSTKAEGDVAEYNMSTLKTSHTTSIYHLYYLVENNEE
jgi:hypothetical protein